VSTRVLVLVVVVIASWAPVAHADRADDAREHYQNATSHFAVGEFADAAKEFQAAYMLKPDPALLFNAAQAYRLANNPSKALILYKNYLQLYPNAENIDEVRSQIAKLQQATASASPSPSAPPPVATTHEQQPAAPHPIAAASHPAPAAAPTATSHVVKEQPVYKKWWLWTIVGVVVAGGAVTTAVLLTRPQNSWSNAPDVGPGSSNALIRW